ncbi:MAG: hypothetical protein RIA64_08890 [Rhodospirillales bacterium]
MRTSFQEFLQSARLVTNLGLGALSAVSGYFTYQGAAMMLGSPNELSLSALVYASGVTSLIFVFWHYVLHIVPRMETLKTRLQAMSVLALGSIFIIALSSWMNVMALAGNGAQDASLRNVAGKAEITLRQAADQTTELDSIRDELSITANRYESLARSEIERGTLTGAAGRGRVSESLLSSKATIDRLIRTLETNAANRQEAIEKAKASLLRMDAIIDDSLAMEDQAQAFKTELGTFANIVANLSVNGDAEAVSRSMRALASQTGLFAASGNQSLAKTQADVIARISEELAQTGERIAQAADEVARTEAASAPTFSRMSTAKAVFLYAGDLVPYWAGGIGMDLMPVALVLLLMLLFVTTRQPEPTDPDVAKMPFGDVQKLFFELERMRQVSDQDALAPHREQAYLPATPQITGETRTTPAPEDHDKAKPPWSEDDAKDWSRFTGQHSA